RGPWALVLNQVKQLFQLGSVKRLFGVGHLLHDRIVYLFLLHGQRGYVSAVVLKAECVVVALKRRPYTAQPFNLLFWQWVVKLIVNGVYAYQCLFERIAVVLRPLEEADELVMALAFIHLHARAHFRRR